MCKRLTNYYFFFCDSEQGGTQFWEGIGVFVCCFNSSMYSYKLSKSQN